MRLASVDLPLEISQRGDSGNLYLFIRTLGLVMLIAPLTRKQRLPECKDRVLGGSMANARTSYW